MQLTFTEEHYLKAIYLASHNGQEIVAVKSIAAALNTTVVSTTAMLKRLSQKDLVGYVPYRGVSMTSEGVKQAAITLRRQRLWEVFLVEKLNLGWDEVHEATEELEHVRSEKVIERLDEFLEFPKFDPHGDPIPDREGKVMTRSSVPLSQAKSRVPLVITGVQLYTSEFLQHLDRFNIRIGSQVRLIERLSFDHNLVVEVGGKEVTISQHVGNHLLVAEVDENEAPMSLN